MLTDRLRTLLRRSGPARALATPLLAVRRRIVGRRHALRASVWDDARGLLAEPPVVRVDTFGGTFELDPRSHILARLMLDGDYEPEVFGLCASLLDPERDVIDVGANAGFFSVGLAQRLTSGRLLAIEPSAAMVARLRGNLERNGVTENVLVEPLALSDREGTASLNTIQGNEEYSTLGEAAHPALASSGIASGVVQERIRTARLDDVVAAHGLRPALLKVDVEGFEAQVFGGAMQTLRDHRPAVVTEFSADLLRANGSSPEAMVRLFESCGYRILDPFTPGHPPVTPTFLRTTEEVLCLPEEHPLA